MGKDWAGPFFPPSLIFRSSIDRFLFRFMLLFHSILTFMKDLYQSENQVFNPTRLLVLLHCWVGKDWGRPILPPPPPPSIMLGSFNLLFSRLVYVTLWLYLNNFEWPIPKWKSSFQSNKLIGTSTLWGGGKTGPAHSFPPPKCWDLSIYPLDFWVMLFFCCIWTLLTYTKQRIKFSNQQVYL